MPNYNPMMIPTTPGYDLNAAQRSLSPSQSYFAPNPLTFSQPLSGVSMGNPSIYGLNSLQNSGLENNEAAFGRGYQNPLNTIDVRNQLQNALGRYSNNAGQLANTRVNLGRVRLSNNFVGPEYFQNLLNNGIDYFGQLGISEGLQNINLQRDAANRKLMSALGQDPGNSGLLSVLQNQNLFRSQLAGNPLISQAQKDTSGRVSEMVNLQNQLTQLLNQTRLQQTGANQQAQLSELQARLAAQQPQQNLLEILSNLQGQNRGVMTTQRQTLGRNFKS